MTRRADASSTVGRVTRVRALALLALGCALAAAAASTGPFLEADRTVPPFAIRRPRPPATPPPRAGERTRAGRGLGAKLLDLLDTVFEVLAIIVAVAVVLWFGFLLARALVRLMRLRLTGLGVAAGGTKPYDPGEESDEDAETALRRRVAEELRLLSADLDEDVEPREAVIACYVRMEAALANAGTRRAVTETPLELLARVLGAYDVPAADVRRLTDLFTEARFSEHPVTDDMRDAARRSLAAVADALAVRA